jgi:hypothetical protein
MTAPDPVLGQRVGTRETNGLAALTAAPSPDVTAQERELADMVARLMRQPRDKFVMVLHLSRIAPALLCAYHVRVARARLSELAVRFTGRLFPMRNGDFVLLGALPADVGEGGGQTGTLDDIAASLERIFAGVTPAGARLASVMRLDRSADALLAYLTARTDDVGQAAAPVEPSADLAGLAALQSLVSSVPAETLMAQQTGIAMMAGGGGRMASGMRPVFRELGLALAAPHFRPLVAAGHADPYLYRHFAGLMDTRIMQVLLDDLAISGPLTRPASTAPLPIHLELAPATVMSPLFARFAGLARDAGLPVCVCMTAEQAACDIGLTVSAKARLGALDSALIVHRLDLSAFDLFRPEQLGPDLIKILWSPRLLAEGAGEVARWIARADLSRLVLQGTDTDQAFAWGLARGLALFQGPFIDQVLAATRMANCQAATGCALRQCQTRAAALSSAGRDGCRNLALLDANAGLAE